MSRVQHQIRQYQIGDGCLCWSFGSEIDLENSLVVLGVFRRLKDHCSTTDTGILDLVPAYTELAVHFDPVFTSVDDIIERVEQVIKQQLDSGTELGLTVGKQHNIPVDYNGEDLERVAEVNGLTIQDVIGLHSRADYTVAMVGFLPHFPYLIGLDKRLETPRLDSPRKKVPAGSVAIGGAQTGIYPQESPGGWNIIGRTDPVLLDEIEPGDRIKFETVGGA